MKERPILMRGPLVCATLEDRKWQTRRIVVPQPESSSLLEGGGWIWNKGTVILGASDGLFQEAMLQHCPHGGVGDRLWVRETFARLWFNANDGWQTIYRADALDCMRDAAAGQWKPSIHMPRWASRLTLENTAVRVEQLQDISEEDAIAEGMQCPGIPAALTNRTAFAHYWDSITTNPAHRWAANPWVWAISYTRLEQAT